MPSSQTGMRSFPLRKRPHGGSRTNIPVGFSFSMVSVWSVVQFCSNRVGDICPSLVGRLLGATRRRRHDRHPHAAGIRVEHHDYKIDTTGRVDRTQPTRNEFCGSGILFVIAAIRLSYTNIMVSSPKVVLPNQGDRLLCQSSLEHSPCDTPGLRRVDRRRLRAFGRVASGLWPAERKEKSRWHAKSPNEANLEIAINCLESRS